MKLKKVLALMSALVMSVSIFAATAVVADAAVAGVTATLEFTGYETIGTNTFAHIAVKATIPDTLVSYKMTPADWITTEEDTYEGKMIQAVGFDIPNVEGLSYIASKSSAADYVQIQNNTVAGQVTVYAANTGSFDTYYAGEVDVLANLCYRITGDAAATYELALSNAVIKMVEFTNPTSATPVEKGYTFADFTVTNATIKPEEKEESKAKTVTAWDTDEGLLIIGKLDAGAVVDEYGAYIKDSTGAEYALPEAASVKATGYFKMIDANKPSAAGYYGINIIGIAADTYTVAAYADGVVDTATIDVPVQ